MRSKSRDFQLYTVVNDYLANINIDIKNLKNSKPMFVEEMALFVEAIEKGDISTDSAEDGVAVMKILDAIYESGETGHEVIIK